MNVAEFWRRWHITFSNWLRDYLFDVLPKRRKHSLLSYGYAFLITFTLGRLWHGISWNFLIWGVLHGLALGVVFAWKLWRRLPSVHWWAKLLGGLITFNFVCFTWIFFRASSLPVRWFETSAGLAARTPFWVQGLAMAALILLIQTLAGRGSAPFVYGNF